MVSLESTANPLLLSCIYKHRYLLTLHASVHCCSKKKKQTKKCLQKGRKCWSVSALNHSIGLFLSIRVMRHDLWSQCGDGYGRGMEWSLKSAWVLNPMGNNILKLAVCSHQAFFVLNLQKDLGDWVTCREVYLPDSAWRARTELLWGETSKAKLLHRQICENVKCLLFNITLKPQGVCKV